MALRIGAVIEESSHTSSSALVVRESSSEPGVVRISDRQVGDHGVAWDGGKMALEVLRRVVALEASRANQLPGSLLLIRLCLPRPVASVHEVISANGVSSDSDVLHESDVSVTLSEAPEGSVVTVVHVRSGAGSLVTPASVSSLSSTVAAVLHESVGILGRHGIGAHRGAGRVKEGGSGSHVVRVVRVIAHHNLHEIVRNELGDGRLPAGRLAVTSVAGPLALQVLQVRD